MDVILRSVLGFLLQIGPSVILCVLPFGKSDFRFTQRWVYIDCILICLLTSFCFPFTLVLITNVSLENTNLIFNIYMLAVLLLFAALYFWIVRTEFVKKLLVLLLVVFYAATQYLIVNLTVSVFYDERVPEPYPTITLALYAVTTAVLFPAYAVIMRKGVKDYLAEVELKNIRREFVFVLLITSMYFLMLILYSSVPVSNLTEFWWWITPAFLLTAVILYIFYWALFRESVRRKRDAEYQRMFEIQQMHYKSIERDMEATRRMRHDMRHHLRSIYEMLNDGKTEEMASYLSSLIDQTSRRETYKYCNNSGINALLQYYIGQAKDDGISCEVIANCGETNIDAVDLTILLGNTLENALQACRKFDNDPWIKVQIGVFGGTLLIKVDNACRGVHLSGGYRISSGNYLPAEAFTSIKKAEGMD